jgi:hypothetical protein
MGVGVFPLFLPVVMGHGYRIGPDALIEARLDLEAAGLPGDRVVGFDPDPVAVSDAALARRLGVDRHVLGRGELGQQGDLTGAALLVLDLLGADQIEIIELRAQRSKISRTVGFLVRSSVYGSFRLSALLR